MPLSDPTPSVTPRDPNRDPLTCGNAENVTPRDPSREGVTFTPPPERGREPYAVNETSPDSQEKPTIPTWLRHQLETKTGAPLSHRYTRPTTCQKCGALILTGLDEETAALTTHVDPTPLTPELEIAALLTGRTTYNAAHHAGRTQLSYRDRWRIQTPPSDTHLVLPEHRCGGLSA